MNPCIGWLADPPCPAHGRLHGCEHPAGHEDHARPHSRDRQHRCQCGAVAKPEHYLNLRGARKAAA